MEVMTRRLGGNGVGTVVSRSSGINENDRGAVVE